MAILREGIVIGNNYVNEMRSVASDLLSVSSDIISYLNANENFQMFREGTEKGNAIYNDLKVCLNIIEEKLVPTVEQISSTTSNLLSEQEKINGMN